MEAYEAQYEEYKKTLLQSHAFRDGLRMVYEKTRFLEKDYIERDGVLDKVIALSGICGFCYALTFSLIQLDKFPGFLVRIALAVVGTVCFLRARSIGSEFKSSSGRASFRSYQYKRYIEDRVRSDKEAELKFLLRDLLSSQINKEVFCKQYEALSRYDRYLRDLVDDYQFNDIVTKNL